METAIQEDADLIGLSVLSGAHMTLFRKLIELLAERDASDIVVFGGGIVPEEDIPVLEEIKQCESGGDYTAHNPTSSASGAYQFLDMVWQSTDAGVGYASADAAPEHVQDAAAVELYSEWGTFPWLPSAHCWG